MGHIPFYLRPAEEPHSIELHKKPDEVLIAQTIKAAMELGYSEYVINKIRNAKTEIAMGQIMTWARHNA